MTTLELLLATLAEDPSRIVVEHRGRGISGRAFLGRARAMAVHLRSAGLREGDSLGVATADNVTSMQLLLAAWMCGAAPLVLDFRLSARQLGEWHRRLPLRLVVGPGTAASPEGPPVLALPPDLAAARRPPLGPAFGRGRRGRLLHQLRHHELPQDPARHPRQHGEHDQPVAPRPGAGHPGRHPLGPVPRLSGQPDGLVPQPRGRPEDRGAGPHPHAPRARRGAGAARRPGLHPAARAAPPPGATAAQGRGAALPAAPEAPRHRRAFHPGGQAPRGATPQPQLPDDLQLDRRGRGHRGSSAPRCWSTPPPAGARSPAPPSRSGTATAFALPARPA